MHSSKKERLIRKGWTISTAQEFLGLSAEELAYIELRLRLSNSLKKRRRSRQITQQALARQIRSSQSRVAKMEAGDASVSIELLLRALLHLGATRRKLGQIIGRAA